MFSRYAFAYLSLICLSLGIPIIGMDNPGLNYPYKQLQTPALAPDPLLTQISTLLRQTGQTLREAYQASPAAKAQLAVSYKNQLKQLEDLSQKLSYPAWQLKAALKQNIQLGLAYVQNFDPNLVAPVLASYKDINMLLPTPITAPVQAQQQAPQIPPRIVPQPQKEAHTAECSICYEEKSVNNFYKLSCGHEYCKECLNTNITNALKEQQTANVRCPEPSCKKPLENEDVEKIVADKNKFKLFSDIKLNEYLIAQKAQRCPTPNCPFGFINERTDQFTVECPACNKEYCAQCLHPHASTISCNKAEEMRALSSDPRAAERATEQWKQQNTKQCPRCKVAIQKNEGCQHMKCRSCEHEFCWICLKDWRNHTYCAVNRAVQPQQQIQQPAQELNALNEHLFFARDTRGIAPRLSMQLVRYYPNFVTRFERLSCQKRDEWVARITQQMENSSPFARGVFLNQQQRAQNWMQALEAVERNNRPQPQPANVGYYNPTPPILHGPVFNINSGRVEQYQQQPHTVEIRRQLHIPLNERRFFINHVAAVPGLQINFLENDIITFRQDIPAGTPAEVARLNLEMTVNFLLHHYRPGLQEFNRP